MRTSVAGLACRQSASIMCRPKTPSGSFRGFRPGTFILLPESRLRAIRASAVHPIALGSVHN
jgi:hypothetical protein